MGRCNAKTTKGLRCRNSCTNKLDTCYIHSDECSICFHRLGSGNQPSKLVCGHLFHEDCISRWLDINGKCPICRYPSRPPVVTVYDNSNVVVPTDRIVIMLRSIYRSGQLHTNRVVVTVDDDVLRINSYDSGQLMGSEPFFL